MGEGFVPLSPTSITFTQVNPKMSDLTGTVYNESLETIWSVHLVYTHSPDRHVECNAKVHWVSDEYGNELAWFEPPPDDFLEAAQMTESDVLTFITEEVLI